MATTSNWFIWDTYTKKTVIGGFESSEAAYLWIDRHYAEKRGYTVREIQKES